MQEEKLKTGTTTLGMVCKDCVILASETQSTLGYMISSKNAQKVFKLDDKIALTVAGGVGDTQSLIRMLKAEINIYKLTRCAEFTVQATVTLLSNILQSNRYYPYMAMLVVGGVDRNGSHVYSVDPVGGVEEDNFVVTGSGSPIALGVMEDKYKESLTEEEGVALAVRAIRSAKGRDVFSASGNEIRVAVINKNGVNFVDKEKIRELAK